MKRSKDRQLYFFIGGLYKIIDGLVRIISLGYYWTDFEYQFIKNSMFK